MQETLKTLAAMQSLDDAIGRYKILQEELPKQLNDLIDAVTQATADLVAGEAEKLEINKQQRALEGDIKAFQEKIRKHGGQLADIKTNKEYKALNSEIAYLKEKIAEAESALLDLMEQETAAKEKNLGLKKALETAEKNKQSKEGDLRAQIAELEGTIESTRSERNHLARSLPTPLIKRYGNMIKNKGNKAVAYNKDGACGGCGFVIRQQMRIELQLMKKIVYCENCGRILLDNGVKNLA